MRRRRLFWQGRTPDYAWKPFEDAPAPQYCPYCEQRHGHTAAFRAGRLIARLPSERHLRPALAGVLALIAVMLAG